MTKIRSNRPYTYLSTTTGMCRSCRKLVASRIIEREGRVFQQNLCPSCGQSEAIIAESFDWYAKVSNTVIKTRPPAKEGNPVRLGCPFDCGPCAFHASACNLPVFSITNACDLSCPICFTYNRPDRLYHMKREEMRALLDRLLDRTGSVDLVNLTGGEPTMHPNLLELIAEASRPEIGRVTVNSNGLRLAREPELCKSLAETGAYVILSFDTLDPDTSKKIHGKDLVEIKRKALENLQNAGVGTTLLHVMISGVNEKEFGGILDLALSHDVVRSITVQTMTFTGHGGKNFNPRSHIPLDQAARFIEEATHGKVGKNFFRSLPAAHPLCYQVAYAFKWKGIIHDFSELFEPNEIQRLLGNGYLMRPSDESEAIFRTALDRLWAKGGNENLLDGFKSTIRELYPSKGDVPTISERQRIGERNVLTVYLHAHMDEDNFDVARVSTCPDQVPDPEGRLIPACTYNLFYRMKDPRFWNDSNC
ncbi:radical SAM protein [bacterium]|nr:radical SAM protein [bacterium]